MAGIVAPPSGDDSPERACRLPIDCAAFEGGRKLADIPIEHVDQWLQRPGCVVPTALRDATGGELRQRRQAFDPHELAAEAARHGHPRGRGMNAESMPELPWKWGYAMALGLIAAAVAPPCRRSRRAGRL